MVYYNYKSDFSFILNLQYKDKEGKIQDMGFPEYSFKLYLYTNKLNYQYVCEYNADKDTYNNVQNVDNKLIVNVDNHKLSPGKLYASIKIELPNEWYDDNIQHLNYEHFDTGVCLSSVFNDINVDTKVDFILPFIKGDQGEKGDKGDKGETFEFDDLTQDEISILQQPALEAAEEAQIAIDEVNEVLEKIENKEIIWEDVQ